MFYNLEHKLAVSAVFVTWYHCIISDIGAPGFIILLVQPHGKLQFLLKLIYMFERMEIT